MKFCTTALAVALVGVARGQDWIQDPRCCAKDPSECEDRRLELGLDQAAFEELLSRNYDKAESEKHEQGESSQLEKGNGGSHRQLDTFEFGLKMYWQPGFCWQAEWFERHWCLSCGGSETNPSCEKDESLVLRTCNENDDGQRFEWVAFTNYEGSLKARNKDLCWHRISSRQYAWKECDFDNIDQRLSGFDLNNPFNIKPAGLGHRCMSNEHSPRNGEVIYAERCDIAYLTRSDKWVIYESEGDYLGPPTKAPSSFPTTTPMPTEIPSSPPSQFPSVSPTASPTDLPTRAPTQRPTFLGAVPLDNVGSCGVGGCGRCQGDCDDHEDCAEDLVCLQNDDVIDGYFPGCIGTSTSNDDFCVDPTHLGLTAAPTVPTTAAPTTVEPTSSPVTTTPVATAAATSSPVTTTPVATAAPTSSPVTPGPTAAPSPDGNVASVEREVGDTSGASAWNPSLSVLTVIVLTLWNM